LAVFLRGIGKEDEASVLEKQAKTIRGRSWKANWV
jgi:hypothetical protein